MKYYGTRAETIFRLSAKRTNQIKSAGASVQSTTDSRVVRISGTNAGYTMFRGRYLRVNLLVPGPRLMKKNFPGRGLTKVEKHCRKRPKQPETISFKGSTLMAIYVAGNNRTYLNFHVKCPTFCLTLTKSGVPRDILMSLQYHISRKSVQREPSRYKRTYINTDRNTHMTKAIDAL